MAKEPKRISLALFDEELKTLINTSAKIFPMSQEDIDNNLNPNNYEYAKVGRAIYAWHDGKWEYIIADDIEVLWTDIEGKPLTFPPINHEHSEEEITNLDKYSKSEADNLLSFKADKDELHSHDNKSLLDTITQALINAWDSAVTHISDMVRHVTQADKDKWDAVVNKADKTYVDTALEDKADKTYVDIELNKKSPLGHDHDGAYYKKAEVDSKLSGKSNIAHKHTEVDITDLDKYTQAEVDAKLGLKSDDGHGHAETDIVNLDKYTKAEVDTKLASKSDAEHGHPELHEHVNKALLDKLIETSPGDSYDLSNLDYIEDIRNGYTEGHAHNNLSVLNTITQALVDGWNSAVSHISDAVKHITSAERTLWNTVSDKADSNHNHDTDYSPTGHNHDNRYYTETEVDNLLSDKSNTGHTHTDKADKTYVDTELGKKTDNTTTSYHINNTTVHVTQTDKTNWNSKQDALGFTPAKETGVIDTGTSGGTAFSIEETNSSQRSAIFLKRAGGRRAGFFWYGNDYPTYGGKFRIHLDDKSDVLFTNVSDILVDGKKVFHEGNFTPSSGITVGTTKPTDGSMWYEVIG